MMTLLSLAGLIIGVVIFLNLLQAKEKVDRIGKPEAPAASGASGAASVKGGSGRLPAAPQRRICPVCRTGLTQEEYLICAMDSDLGENRKRQVHIYGCRHCFLTDGVNLARYEQLKDASV
jgi:hypothetical protein